jgi:pimeloyl-ACP methyl ester carboxylesterase
LAPHIHGPLYYERMGRAGPVMAFVHPNPMDQSCWLYQMARFSTWYRCIAIDIPGYGRSPKADPELSRFDMAQALWETLDDQFPNEPVTLVGCSVGSSLVPHMYKLRPQQTVAMIICGTGYRGPEVVTPNIAHYEDRGMSYRWDFTFKDFSPGFNMTPLASYFATLFTERDAYADLPSILYQLAAPRPGEEFFRTIDCPTIILSGSEDTAHPGAFLLRKLIPGCEMKTLHGAGHACQLEQPWLFDHYMIEFLKSRGLFPELPKIPAAG